LYAIRGYFLRDFPRFFPFRDREQGLESAVYLLYMDNNISYVGGKGPGMGGTGQPRAGEAISHGRSSSQRILMEGALGGNQGAA
jgi:hypothetical protein